MSSNQILTERHPSSRKTFPLELGARHQDAGLQSFKAHQICTIFFSLADLEIFPGKLIAFIFDVGVSIHQ